METLRPFKTSRAEQIILYRSQDNSTRLSHTVKDRSFERGNFVHVFGALAPGKQTPAATQEPGRDSGTTGYWLSERKRFDKLTRDINSPACRLPVRNFDVHEARLAATNPQNDRAFMRQGDVGFGVVPELGERHHRFALAQHQADHLNSSSLLVSALKQVCGTARVASL